MKKIAILGYGTVGKEVYEQIKDKAEVVKILDVRMKGDLFTESIDELLNNGVDSGNFDLLFQQLEIMMQLLDLSNVGEGGDMFDLPMATQSQLFDGQPI